MNCNTGHLVTQEVLDSLDATNAAGYVIIPDALTHAAKHKLGTKAEATVSLTSGGKLSNFAALTRNQRRNARKKLGY